MTREEAMILVKEQMSNKNLIKHVGPLGKVTTYSYNEDGLVNELSIEAEIEDKYDYDKGYYIATSIEFTGAAVVVNPACPEAKIKS